MNLNTFLKSLFLLFACAACTPPAPRNPSLETAASRPKLVVVCVVDQMKEEYLDRYSPVFGNDGFKRLLNDGTRWTNCNYPYSGTETGPGHASIGSGRLPKNHGIIANDWYQFRPSEKESPNWGSVNCVEDLKYQFRTVYPAPATGTDPFARSHANFRGENLTDRVKKSIPGAKVFSMSVKDRSAILMGGASANAALWIELDKRNGPTTSNFTFVSSTHYFPKDKYQQGLPGWIKQFFDQEIAKIPNEWALPQNVPAFSDRNICSDDNVSWERGPYNKREFPYLYRDGSLVWDRVECSPVPLSMLTNLAMEWIQRENLGKDDATDILWISFSSTDTIGHSFGPQSQELLSAYQHLDRELAKLLKYLDETAGRENYVFALTSDHGVCDVPESKNNKLSADRTNIFDKNYRHEIGKELAAKYYEESKSDDDWVKRVMDSGWYLSRRRLERENISVDDAAEKLRDILKTKKGVYRAYTQADILNPKVRKSDPIAESVYLSFDKDRSGDVITIVNPHWLQFESAKYVTTHGSPHSYDTHVPMLLTGPGIQKRAAIDKLVTPLDLAPTLAAILQIDPPKDCDGKILPGIELPAK
ncbi:MAG: alkaline phosphatase family protein [Planctomycetota bacterium]